MSKTDTCLKCGRVGHTSSSCTRPISMPSPQITVEPYDGNDRMVCCNDCARKGVPDWRGHGGCAQFVPAMATIPRHCSTYRPARPQRPAKGHA